MQRLSFPQLFLLFILAAAFYYLHENPTSPSSSISTPQPGSFEWRVITVHDGDTFTLENSKNHRVKVRLYGIDCPELKQPFGRAARQTARDLTTQKLFSLNVVEEDKYGRKVARLASEKGSINQQLVSSGACWWYRFHAPREKDLRQAEKDARVAKRGLWKQGEPTPPWSYRRKNHRES